MQHLSEAERQEFLTIVTGETDVAMLIDVCQGEGLWPLPDP